MAANTRLHLKLSLPRPEFLQHHKKSQPLAPTPEENEEFQFETPGEGGTAEDATEWIKTTIREHGHWEDHLSLIRIDCPHTMAELRQLGRLSKSEGTRQCRKMVRIPVLYDEIGCFMWEKLAALERGPDFGKEDEEKAAEYARGVTFRTMMALDERFRFDQPASIHGTDSITTTTTMKYGRPRQDSEPISPKHINQSQADPYEEKRPSTSYTCNFCHSSIANEHPGIPADIPADALAATRGRIVDSQPPQPSRGSPKARLSRSLSRSSSQTARSTTFFNHSRRSSYSSTLLWRRDNHSGPRSIADTRRSASTSSGHTSAQGSRPTSRDDSLGGRVGSVVGNLGRGVAVAIGGGLAHGYGFAGRADRSGSFWSV